MSCEVSTGTPPHPEPPNSPWMMLSPSTALRHPLPRGQCPTLPQPLGAAGAGAALGCSQGVDAGQGGGG